MRNLVLLQELRALLTAERGEGPSATCEIEKLAADPFLGTIYAISRDKRVIGFSPFSNEVRISSACYQELFDQTTIP